MTRDEHLAWCKQRALEYADRGDAAGAIGSMISDMRKHPETENHAALEMGFLLLVGGHLSGPDEACRFIEGFN